LFGGYRALAAVVITLWAVAFFAILRMGRKPKAIEITAPVPRPPTFAERIQPLVERAAAGKLSGDEKASLERLLIAHWQRRLGLREANGEEVIARLRGHDEAGALLRALEDWLHRPPAPRRCKSSPCSHRIAICRRRKLRRWSDDVRTSVGFVGVDGAGVAGVVEWRRRGRPLVLPFDHAPAEVRRWLEGTIKTANLLPPLLLASPYCCSPARSISHRRGRKESSPTSSSSSTFPAA